MFCFSFLFSFTFHIEIIPRPLLMRIMTFYSNRPFVLDSLLENGLGHQPTWHDQLSPQLQRNKQVFQLFIIFELLSLPVDTVLMIVITFTLVKLQDTLMQREEELARLQEENNKLKEFLNSSYVKSLEEKTKVGNTMYSDVSNFIPH